jgi:hypothetical protein
LREPDLAERCIRCVRTLVTAALGCVLAAGCAADGSQPGHARGAAAEERPAACSRAAVDRTVRAFLDAFNRGDPSALSYIAPSGGWYSVADGRRSHFRTDSHRGLPEYFARRHRRGERLRLLRLKVTYGNGLGHIGFRLARHADDLRGTIAVGKGAVSCDTGRIVVWSMGTPRG